MKSSISVVRMCRLAADEGDLTFLQALCRQRPGGVSRLPTERYFTYQLDGEQVVFTDDLRQRVEAAIGTALIEEVHPAPYANETALVIPLHLEAQVQGFVNAMLSRRSAATV